MLQNPSDAGSIAPMQTFFSQTSSTEVSPSQPVDDRTFLLSFLSPRPNGPRCATVARQRHFRAGVADLTACRFRKRSNYGSVPKRRVQSAPKGIMFTHRIELPGHFLRDAWRECKQESSAGDRVQVALIYTFRSQSCALGGSIVPASQDTWTFPGRQAWYQRSGPMMPMRLPRKS
jgi:hypothetical protein